MSSQFWVSLKIDERCGSSKERLTFVHIYHNSIRQPHIFVVHHILCMPGLSYLQIYVLILEERVTANTYLYLYSLQSYKGRSYGRIDQQPKDSLNSRMLSLFSWYQSYGSWLSVCGAMYRETGSLKNRLRDLISHFHIGPGSPLCAAYTSLPLFEPEDFLAFLS